MVFARHVARAILVLYVICFLANVNGISRKKRGVTEIQLMHDWAEYINTKTRLEWLKRKLAEIMDPKDIPGGPPAASNEVRLQKKSVATRVANQDHQLAPGQKSLGKTNKDDVDILSKINPHLE
ncbi:parathyroid hormone [Petaurus breviceps papuanus]|uniref:parathyroid hormone n=1 Tax=Petaurus breviceps papuanus TaxID=3040969 RepID=UPI0036DF3612